MDKPKTEAELFQEFGIRQIMTNRDDILWCIEAGLTKAVDIMEYLRDVDQDTELSTLLDNPMGLLVLEYIKYLWDKRAAEKRALLWDRKAQKQENRGAYGDCSEIHFSGRADATTRFVFDTAMACQGLVAEMLNWFGANVKAPVVLNLLNKYPTLLTASGKDTGVQPDMPLSEGDNFARCGYELYQGGTLWNSNIPMLWEWFERCLPKAIDRGSYHRRLRAPLVPGGYLPDLKVRVKRLEVSGRDLQADGSGWYDPDHPDMEALVGAYGPVLFQFTGIHPETGHMFKGIIYPHQGMNDDYMEANKVGIQFDHLQVKGSQKATHKGLAKVDPDGSKGGVFVLEGVHVGIMRAKTTIGKVGGSFETKENVGPNPKYYAGGTNDPQFKRDKIRVSQLVRQLTIESIDKIGSLGPDGLLARATRSDQHLRRLAEFVMVANQHGASINPLDIPIFASKMAESLGRACWSPAQGAGITGRFPMVVIDATLKPGTVVLSGYKPGTEIACWRFPTILAQGLLILRVVGGRSHHRVDDKVIQNCIFMHPHDITVCQQGDDDGDEVGVSDDPRIVELFRHKFDRDIFHIEPTSEKLPHLASSVEGVKYLRVDPMGPVGKLTIMRANLLAVGAHDMARAFSVLIQEAIDSQKNLVRMTSPERAADLANWHMVDGEYHIHYKCPDTGKYLTNNWLSEKAGEFDMDAITSVYDQAMIGAGCSKVVNTEDGRKQVAGWALGWRNQVRLLEDENGEQVERKLRKSIAVDNWDSWRNKQDGPHGNLVHLSHDVAMLRWKRWRDSFVSGGEIPTKEVLPQILAKMGKTVQPLNISWNAYAHGLRIKAGIVEYGAAMKKARAFTSSSDGNINGPVNEQARISRINGIRAQLELRLSVLSAQEIMTIWMKELTSAWWYTDRRQGGRVHVTDVNLVPEGKKYYVANKPNYAFMAVCSDHSPIMRELGMEAGNACDWLDEHKLVKYVGWARKQPNPFKAISELVLKNTGHAAAKGAHDDNGEPVRFEDCACCVERLQTGLIRSIRADKSADEQTATKALTTRMNRHMPHEPVPGLPVKPSKKEKEESMASEDPWA